MRFKFNPLTFDQKLALRRSAEDSLNAMNPLWGEFRKAATAPAIISLLDSLDEQAQELHKAKMALADAGCVLVEWKQRLETAGEQLQQSIPESLIENVCHTAAEIYRASDEDKAQEIINRIREALHGFKIGEE